MKVSITPLDLSAIGVKADPCCFRVVIDDKDKVSGVWCSKSGFLAINGERRGWANSKEKLIASLRKETFTKWVVDDL